MALTPQEISDRLESEDILIRYCYAVDDRDWETYREIFTPDAVIDDNVTGGVRSGVEEHVVKGHSRSLSPLLTEEIWRMWVIPLLPRHWVVERTFSWLGQSRRLRKDYERLCETSEALVYATMSRLMVRRLAKG